MRVLRKGGGERLVGFGVAIAARDRRVAVSLREDDGAIVVGAGLDLLRPFEALRPQLLRLALPFRFHPVVDRLTGLERQIGAIEPHLVDLDAERLGLGCDFALDDVEDVAALLGQQRPERNLPELTPRRRADELGKLRVRRLARAQRLVEAQRIDDAIARVRLHFEPLLIAHDHLLERRLEQERARRCDVDAVDERRLELEPRLVDDADRRAEPDNETLFALVDDIDRRGGDVECERGEAERDQRRAALHFAAPGGWSTGAGANGVISDIGR